MATKLSDTQRDLLAAAAQRGDRFLTLPEGRRAAAARQAAAPLLAAGLAREVRARGEAPVWRQDKDSQCTFAIKLTTAGMKAAAGLAGGDGNGPRNEASSQADCDPSRTERASQVDEAKIEKESPATSRAAPR